MPATASPPAPGLAAAPVPVALPVQLTGFVGRARELAEIARLLAGTRLLTLTGAGGSGKTRLALELARAEAEAGREAIWVELAPVCDPALVGERVAAAAGSREAGRSPETLAEALRDRAALLVLDNCEHLVDACAALVDGLLRSAPGLRILATSREPLGVAGETAWLVPPLALSTDAVQLFVERAQAAYPLFRLTDENAAAVAQICRRLDGLPLALELAAARVRVLPPEQLAARLDDVFRLLGSGSRAALPRHRTLRATIDWSYQLLAEPERVLLERLGVFACGFPLEAAEAVCSGGGIEAADVLDGLAALIDKSLVMMREDDEGPRYRLLDTVRQYARERLAERGGEEGLRERHACWYLDYVTGLEPGLMGAFPDALSRAQAEHDDFRAALAWSIAAGRGDDLALPLAARLAWFWYYRAYYAEGLRWLHAVLEASTDAPTPARGTALRATGAITNYRGDPAGALPWLERSEALWRRLEGHDRQLVFTLTSLAQVLADLGRLDEARARAREARALAERGRDWMMQSYVLLNAASAIALVEGDLEAADRCFVDAEALYVHADALGGAIGHALIASWRAQIALWRGELDRAEALAHRTLDLVTPLRHHWLGARALRVLGHLAARRGDHERAARLLGAADARLRQLGAAVLSLERTPHEQGLVDLRTQLGPQRFAVWFGSGAALSFEAVVGEVRGARAASPPVMQPAQTPPAAGGAADLVVRALGALEVECDGAEVPREAWGSSKTRELLLFLLCRPGGCTREQAGAALWPDASTAQVRNNFHVTLHRLRKALRHADWIVAEDGCYRVAPAVRVAFDADALERDVAAALRLPETSPERRALLERALASVRGEFLEQEPVGDWHFEMRDRLRRLHRDAVLASCSAEALRALVVRDPLDEEACRALMRLLARAGERADALRLHRRLGVMLESELGVSPDEETEALAARIQAGERV